MWAVKLSGLVFMDHPVDQLVRNVSLKDGNYCCMKTRAFDGEHKLRCRRWKWRRNRENELTATRQTCSPCSTRRRFTSSRYWQTAWPEFHRCT